MKNGPYELVIAPPEYPGMKYRGRYCYEHCLVWWRNKGALPVEGFVIHHKDENKRNNVIENLEIKSKSEHAAHHGKDKPRVFTEAVCPGCGGVIKREKKNTSENRLMVCSLECRGKTFGRGRPASMYMPQKRKDFLLWSDGKIKYLGT